MKMSRNILAVTCAALMLGTALPAAAASLGGVSVGSNSDGGTAASATNGDTSGVATVGGGSNVASVDLGSGGTGSNLAIGDTSGDLVTASQNGNTTDGNVNLGGIVPSGIAGGSATPSAQLAAAYSSLSGGDQGALKLKCRQVLASPAGFGANVVALCRLIGNAAN